MIENEESKDKGTESEVKDIFKNRRMKLLKKIEESEVELEESKNDIKE